MPPIEAATTKLSDDGAADASQATAASAAAGQHAPPTARDDSGAGAPDERSSVAPFSNPTSLHVPAAATASLAPLAGHVASALLPASLFSPRDNVNFSAHDRRLMREILNEAQRDSAMTAARGRQPYSDEEQTSPRPHPKQQPLPSATVAPAASPSLQSPLGQTVLPASPPVAAMPPAPANAALSALPSSSAAAAPVTAASPPAGLPANGAVSSPPASSPAPSKGWLSGLFGSRNSHAAASAATTQTHSSQQPPVSAQQQQQQPQQQQAASKGATSERSSGQQ